MANNAEVFKKLRGKLAIAKKVAKRKAIQELLVLIPELIRLRTRSGAGINKNLKELEESTEKYRQRYKDNLHPDTSPKESNLTATGQLLDAIIGKKVPNGLLFTISSKKRKGELSGAKSTLTNNQVRKYVEDNGREFFGLSDKEQKEAIDIAFEIIREELSKVFN